MSGVRRGLAAAGGLVVLEVRLYRALALWVLRRPSLGEPGDVPVGYARLGTPVMALWVFASATELVVLHLIVPWEPVRLALDVLGVWGLVWMLGLMTSLRVFPHLVGPTTLRLRYGVMADVSVPWTCVTALVAREQDWPSSVRTLQEGDDGELAVAVSARTNVVATLAGPTTLTVRGEPRTVTSVAFWVDDPRDFAREHRGLVAPATGQ